MDNLSLSKSKDIFVSFLNFSLPIKLVIGALITFVAGAGFLAVISEYATYSYAIYTGFRPPIEGVPYLKVTVAFASFLFQLVGSLIFLITYVLIKNTMRLIVKGLRMLVILFFAINPLKKLTTVKNGILDFIEFLLVLPKVLSDDKSKFKVDDVYIPTLALASLVFNIINLIQIVFKESLGSIFSHTYIALVFSVVFGVIFYAEYKPKYNGLIAAFATIIFLLFATASMFNSGYYSALIRMLGYGGGVEVKLELDEDSKDQRTISGLLMLRTNDCYVILINDQKEFIEIPKDRVKSLTHEQGAFGLRKI